MIRGTCGFVLEPLLCTQGMLVYQRLNQELAVYRKSSFIFLVSDFKGSGGPE